MPKSAAMKQKDAGEKSKGNTLAACMPMRTRQATKEAERCSKPATKKENVAAETISAEATSAAEKIAAEPITSRDIELALVIWQCLKEPPKIDFDKFRELTKLKNLDSARTTWGYTRRRLLSQNGPIVYKDGAAAMASRKRKADSTVPEEAPPHIEKRRGRPRKSQTEESPATAAPRPTPPGAEPGRSTGAVSARNAAGRPTNSATTNRPVAAITPTVTTPSAGGGDRETTQGTATPLQVSSTTSEVLPTWRPSEDQKLVGLSRSAREKETPGIAAGTSRGFRRPQKAKPSTFDASTAESAASSSSASSHAPIPAAVNTNVDGGTVTGVSGTQANVASDPGQRETFGNRLYSFAGFDMWRDPAVSDELRAELDSDPSEFGCGAASATYVPPTEIEQQLIDAMNYHQDNPVQHHNTEFSALDFFIYDPVSKNGAPETGPGETEPTPHGPNTDEPEE